jgi:S-layer homology domain
MSTLLSLMLVGLSLGQTPQPVQPFPDVPKTQRAYAAVTELHEKGILKGYPGQYDRSTPHAAFQSLLLRFELPCQQSNGV